MTVFKMMNEIAGIEFSNLMKSLKPCKLTRYEGIMNGPIIHSKSLFAEEFICPNCGFKDCYVLLHNAKKYLTCMSQECIYKNSNREKVYQLPKLKPLDCNAPEIIANANFRHCDQSEEIKTKTKEFAEKHNGFCLIAGLPGRGKSYLAVSMMKSFLDIDRDAFFICQAELNQRWLELSTTGKTVLPFLEMLQSKKLLVLDDLGSMKFTEPFGDFMFMLIDKRRNTPGCGTIITTNLDSKNLNQLLGSSFVSRVTTGLIIKVEGNDKRIQF